MDKRPHILLTNDDGIHSDGLFHLWKGLQEYADISVVAPLTEKSGVGAGISLNSPLLVHKMKWQGECDSWAVQGTPADCVKMALSVFLEKAPDLVISGINKGSNAGRSIFHSGTVGGAIEAVMRDIPSIAISSIDYSIPNFSIAEKYVARIAKHLLAHPLPSGTLLNVNVPSAVEDIVGIRLARQGKSYWRGDPIERSHPEGFSYYWLGGGLSLFEEDEESDISLLQKGYIACVPVYVNELTHHSEYEARKEMFNALFNHPF
ncbi:MAG: 5'/3'-nucleotidase SurE [Chlamydiales bacterium]|nr:5'/3'-nucleotidase SurE [Chlamydiales bacterium]